jgi:CCR4-NOT transcription complex subunit 4
LEEIRNHHDGGSDVKPDDDLGFDPFHETQKALAELMENEMQIHQQRIFQQQQQQQREREEQNRVQHQQTLASLGQQHFSQVSIMIRCIFTDIKNILYKFLVLYQNS